ncbi:MAG: DUF4157 domain-containing protein [Anaerolineae bacterium]
MSTRLQTKVKAPSAPTPLFMPMRTRLLNRNHAWGCTPGPTGKFADFRGGRLVSQPPLIQAKLTINQPNDRYEQEADRVAEAVMRMPDPRLQRQVEPEEGEETLQAKPLAGQITPLVQRQAEPEEEEEEEPIQTKQSGGQTRQVGPSLQAHIHSLRLGGQPLPEFTRAFFKPCFGYDLSQVRVHADARAAESARALKARAFTVGRDVVFGAGQYTPGTISGRRLLAHELAHVIQQGAAALTTLGPSLSIADRASPAEREARQFAAHIMRERPIAVSERAEAAIVQRDDNDEDEEELRLRWPGVEREPMFQLRLDPEIEMQMAVIRRMQQLLELETMRSSLPRLDLSTLAASLPPPWLPTPSLGPGRPAAPGGRVPTTPRAPLVPRGAGPATPRPAETGDVLRAILRIPAVDSALTRLRAEATDRVRRDWRRLSTGERALVITQTAVIGAGAIGGILSSPEASQAALDLIQNRDLPVPGVPGLNFQFNATGPNRMVRFTLNVGALLPPSWGFR